MVENENGTYRASEDVLQVYWVEGTVSNHIAIYGNHLLRDLSRGIDPAHSDVYDDYSRRAVR